MNARTIAVFTAVIALLGLLAFGVFSDAEGKISVGDKAPDKALPVLDGTGEQSLADYRGKWVLLNFWASWCKPCRSEAPDLEALQRKHAKDGFTVIGIDIDDNSDDAAKFVAEYGLTYPQLRAVDGPERRKAYGMTGLPENFLIDPDGKIALILRGQVTQEFLDDKVSPLIEGGAPPQ